MQKASKIILGIDPGSVVMGYGLIRVTGNTMTLLEMGVLKLSEHKDIYKRLERIHHRITEIVAQHQPDAFAIEAPFFGKNVQSMLKLGRAQGVAIAAAIQAQLPVFEYAPKKVKQSITGNGNASKDQVLKMVQQLLSFKEKPTSLDATDALAVAVCHYFQLKNPDVISGKSAIKSWEDFIKKNPSVLRSGNR